MNLGSDNNLPGLRINGDKDRNEALFSKSSVPRY